MREGPTSDFVHLHLSRWDTRYIYSSTLPQGFSDVQPDSRATLEEKWFLAGVGRRKTWCVG